ncbi:MAG TPA: NAD(P)/FAD-dependent oxidoreductase [Oceanospirillales bacterium]|nr:NAD(P)/FAD-dependent oxidoreductase [Oceanospirillales bacterium]
MKKIDVIIIGAGAAGLMAAISAGSRGRQVLVLDHANKVGKKILMSGGGRCNFTNLDIQADNYLSHNPHFCKSALSRFTQWDFIDLVAKHNIAYHEKKLGQLFCDNKSRDILNMLLDECADVSVEISENCQIKQLHKTATGFKIQTSQGQWQCQSLIIATGGLSIPKMGATGFGYRIAAQFGLKILPQYAALVPFTLTEKMKKDFESLSGTSVDVQISCNGQSFRENMLFTHRGLSGPAVLQISSYWQQGDEISINLLPDIDLYTHLKTQQKSAANKQLKTVLNEFFSKKLSQTLCELWFKTYSQQPLAQIADQTLTQIAKQLHNWHFKVNATEGYRTAEVTKGGIDTDEISSKTFESHQIKGLYFIGEVLDVTGHLGGYNFQWAWSSGHAAGQYA